MKYITAFTVAFTALIHVTGHAEQNFIAAQVNSAILDAKTMNIVMNLKVANPCDRVASPQAVQDESNPTVIKLEAMSRKSNSACIELVSEKLQTVNLPSLLEMSGVKISKFQTYTIEFDGTNDELIVPGNKLIISVQPQPVLE